MIKVASLFSQLLQHAPRSQFQKLVIDHGAEHEAKGFSCWTQFVAMVSCHLARADSHRGFAEDWPVTLVSSNISGLFKASNFQRFPMPISTGRPLFYNAFKTLFTFEVSIRNAFNNIFRRPIIIFTMAPGDMSKGKINTQNIGILEWTLSHFLKGPKFSPRIFL